MRGRRLARGSAVAVAAALLLGILMLPASAAGPKRIFITKTDENFNGMAGVTFELYEDTDGDGVRDPGEPLLQTKVTDAAGSATFDPVNPGKYVVHEVTPAGYADNPDQPVEIPNAKGKGPTIVFSNTRKPSNIGVNDPTGDTAIHDGTHVFDFGPGIAVACVEQQQQGARLPGDPCPDPEILVAYNHSAGFGTPGGVSGIETSFSSDGGVTWGPELKVPPGSGQVALLGDPTVIYDPVADRWVAAMDAVTNFGTVQRPIMVSRWEGPGSAWTTPVNVFPSIPASPAVAHGSDLAINPLNGNIYVSFTLSNADGTSQPMVSTSTDGGLTFSPPNPVGGPGMHFDFVDGVVSPNGRLNLVFGEFSGAGTYDVFFDTSANPTNRWGDYSTVATGIPRSGTSGACTGSPNLRTLFGSVAPLDAPVIASDPFDSNGFWIVTPAHGAASDESDLLFFSTTDKGVTFFGGLPITPRDVETGRVEFAPTIDVAPDGRISVTYLEADAAGTAYGVEAAFGDTFAEPAQLFVDGVFFLPVMQGSPFWGTDPSFDTHYSNCFGLPPIASLAPGSGFMFAWADGRDPGPVGNNGIDPNIYFASSEGPALRTTLTADLSKTATKLKLSGAISPRPVPGAKVTVTLFVNAGGGFDQVGRKRPTTDAGTGDWFTSFARPDDAKCRVVIEFTGAVGRAPSVPITKTLAC